MFFHVSCYSANRSAGTVCTPFHPHVIEIRGAVNRPSRNFPGHGGNPKPGVKQKGNTK